MLGKLIIIEGSDGSGKQTQSELIYKKLIEKKGEKKIKKITFPNYESKASEPVKMYLAGDFGKSVDDVNAYAASVFFSVDRYASYKSDWEDFYKNGGIVISDRYTTSNMVHQIPKIECYEEQKKYLSWLKDLEWNKMGIPEPNLTFFLDVPYEISKKLIEDRENKITGKRQKDIHERNEKYLKKSYETARNLAKTEGWIIINCVKNNKIRDIESINEEILDKILEIL